MKNNITLNFTMEKDGNVISTHPLYINWNINDDDIKNVFGDNSTFIDELCEILYNQVRLHVNENMNKDSIKEMVKNLDVKE